MNGDQIMQRYRDLGGEIEGSALAQRRGPGGATDLLRPRGIPLHPAFEDDYEEAEDEPVAGLSGSLERVWAPFILIGV